MFIDGRVGALAAREDWQVPSLRAAEKKPSVASAASEESRMRVEHGQLAEVPCGRFLVLVRHERDVAAQKQKKARRSHKWTLGLQRGG